MTGNCEIRGCDRLAGDANRCDQHLADDPDLGAATQIGLFDKDEHAVWAEVWKGMPEFRQDDLSPWKSIIVHFASQEDMSAFSRLVEQTVTVRTQSIWYPEAEIWTMVDKRYADTVTTDG